MITRQVTEVKLFILRLNSVYGRFEDSNIVAISLGSADQLLSWKNSFLADNPSRDEHGYFRVFKDDSPLFNYNDLNVGASSGIYEELVPLDLFNNIRHNYTVLGE